MSVNAFLKNFPGFCIQTFDDSGEGKKSLISCGSPKNYSKKRLTDLNKAGAGIFFTPNSFPGGRRKIELCTKVNAWIVENDSLTIDEQFKNLLAAPLLPSFMVQTKKSVHAYWLAKDAKIENYTPIVRGLVQYFDGDSACTDISRVFRIPGFYHMKDPNNPALVGIVEYEPQRIYTDEEMLRAFPFTEEKKIIHIPTTADPFWSCLGDMNNKMVLERLSGSHMVNNEKITFSERKPVGEYIHINDGTCDAWLDEFGLIGSGKGKNGGPTWIQWLQYYGHSKNDIANWAKINLKDLIPPHILSVDQTPIKIKKGKDIVNILREQLNRPKTKFTWGHEHLDFKFPVIEEGECYALLYGQQGSGKTLFSMWMAKQLSHKMDKVFFLSLEMSTITLYKRFILQKANIDKHKYKDRDYQTEDVLQYINEIDRINFIGIDDGTVYDIPKIEAIIKENHPDILFIDNFNKIRGTKRDALDIDQEVSSGILRLTRQYRLPIFVIHHANKVPVSFKKSTSPFGFRGLSGMRGSNKILDDVDIAIEIARPIKTPEDLMEREKNDKPNPEDTRVYLCVYKDRTFDSRESASMQYKDGEYVDDIKINDD